MINQTRNKKKIEIWSTYPPPYGGVSIHSFRLFWYLKKNDNYELVFKDFGGENKTKQGNVKRVRSIFFEILKILFSFKRKFIHFHSNNYFFWIITALLPLNIKYFITIHNLKLYTLKSGFKKKLVKHFLKNADKIFVNSHTLRSYVVREYNLISDKVIQLEAFMPPLEQEFKGLSPEVLNFRQRNKIVISGNGYKLYKDQNGVDVYGLDLCIQLIYDLNKQGYNVGLIFCLPQIGDIQYWNKLNKIISDLKINSRILILKDPIPNAFEIWGISDLFVRPTNTDVEAISIKEALSQGTNVVASDVCERPHKTLLFSSRDYDDFKKMVVKSLNIKKNEAHYQYNNSSKQIDLFYRKLIT